MTKTKFAHYAQFAEDVTIGRLSEKINKGFFVDVGCFHPKKRNNTWLLYKKGWRGINIDIDSIKIEGFDIIRPGDINIHSAVSDKKGETSYWSNGFYSLTTSLDASFVDGKKGYIQKTAECDTLTGIIDSSKFNGRKVDFLSVDVEGHDLSVLQSLDFDRYDPSLIAVEIHSSVFSDVEKTELYTFLVDKDYCLVGWCGLTLLMANKELQVSLKSTYY